MKLVAVLNRYENSKEIDTYYMKAIKKFGAIPILIDEDNIDLLKICGGILLTGGDNKGKLDDYLIKYSFDHRLPLLGICQGMQSMALYLTSDKLVDADNHYSCNHLIYLSNSKLKKIIKKDKILVNSYHHQQVLSSKVFNVVARSGDGAIEALEGVEDFFQIGVEWHPERMIESESSALIFSEFIKCIAKNNL